MKQMLGLVVLISMIFTAPSIQAKTYTVRMFQTLQNSYWELLILFMREAAKDLDFNLHVHFYDNNHLELLRQVTTVVQSPDKPDVIIFSNFKRMAPQVLQIAEQSQVQSFIINSGLTAEETAEFGGPRMHFQYWLGELLPDDEGAGIALARALLDAARTSQNTSSDRRLQVLGINGEATALPALIRGAALQRVLAASPDANLLQLVNIRGWDRDAAQERFLNLYQRYPHANVVWTANTNLAQGVIAALRQLRLTPGQDLVLGTFDVDEPILRQIDAGEVAVTCGGHFIQGAQAMVVLYDYFHGFDFAAQATTQLKTPLALITKANVAQYLGKLTPAQLTPENLARLDFTRYSHVLNPGGTSAELTFESLMSQF